MKKPSKDLGQKIRDIRKKKSITQKQLAKQMCVTQGYISKIENGCTMPTVDFLSKMRKKFKINLNSLLCP